MRNTQKKEKSNDKTRNQCNGEQTSNQEKYLNKKSFSFKKMNKTGKSLAKLIKKRRDNAVS